MHRCLRSRRAQPAVDSATTAPRTVRGFASVPHPCFRKNFCPCGVPEHEANFSAQQFAPQAHAWFPRPHGHQRRTKGSREPARERPRSPHAVTGFDLARRCSPTRQGSRPTNDCTRRQSSGEYSPSPRVRAIASSPCSRAPSGRSTARLGLDRRASSCETRRGPQQAQASRARIVSPAPRVAAVGFRRARARGRRSGGARACCARVSTGTSSS